MSDEVEFLHADKHKSFLQIDTLIFDEDGQTFPKFAKYQLWNAFRITQKKKPEMKLIFRMQINIKCSYKLVSTFWASKFAAR